MYKSYSRDYWGGGPQQQRQQQQQQPRLEDGEREEKQRQQQLAQPQQEQHPYLASSLFESNAFYNLGRVLSMEQQHHHHHQHQHQHQEKQQEGGDTEGEVYHGGYQYHHYQNLTLNGLADSAPVPPVQRATAGWEVWGGGTGGGAGQEEQHGQGEVFEERDGSYLVCSIRPQDVPPPGAVPLPSYFQTGEQELATQEQEARCRSVCDQLSLLRFPPSLLPSLPSLSSLSPSSSPFKFSREVYLPHRSQGRGRGGGASAASLASMKSGGDGLLQGPPDPPSIADFLRDVMPPSSLPSFSSISSPSSSPRPSSPPSISSFSSSSHSSVISLDNFRGGRGGELEGGLLRTATTGRRPIFPALGNFRDVLCISSPSSPSHSRSSSCAGGGILDRVMKEWEHSSKAPQHLPFAFLPAPSAVAATTISSDDDNDPSSSSGKETLPTPPSSPLSSLSLSLGGQRKSQHIITKPVLTSPSSSPSTPSSRPPALPPSSSGGFRALLESYLWAERAQEDGKEGREGEAGKEEGQRRFTLPNGKVLVATVKGATREAWHIISSSLCSFLFLLLRRLPFVPPHIGRRQWGKGDKEEGKVE
ncbi:Hypothetical protein NocV09_02200670 [Nannochloropsis oceanica]